MLKMKLNKDQKKVVFVIIFAVTLVAVGTLTGTAINASNICGNKVCEDSETIVSCPSDCFSICGDAICQEGEQITCKQDCPKGIVMLAPKQVTLREGLAELLF